MTTKAEPRNERQQLRLVTITWQNPDARFAREIRYDVFVKEQKVPAGEEYDEFDPDAIHAVAFDPDGRAVGTGRLYQDPDDPARGIIGRMAVISLARGRGVGSAIMDTLIIAARRRRWASIMLSSQTHAIPFYEAHGFAAHGPEYLDANIPHRRMTRSLD